MADPVDQDRLIYGGTYVNKVGVAGGIPIYSTRSGSIISAYTGTAGTINTAIDGASNDTYVELGAGTFNLSSTINLDKNRVELRGQVDADGIPTTIINFTNGDERLIKIQQSGWDLSTTSQFTRRNVNSGVSRGSTQVVLASAPTGLVVGQMLFISNPNVDGDGGAFDLYGTDAYCQIVEVTAINSATVDFTPAINADYLTGTTQVGWRASTEEVSYTGVANLSLTRATDGHYVAFQGARNCWARNIQTYDVPSNTYHAYFYGSFRCEITYCDMQHMSNLTNSTYGVFVQLSTNCLVVNNSFTDMPNVMPLYGAHACVFAYNYVNALPYSPANFLSQIVYCHGIHNAYNLIEGNWVATAYNDEGGSSINNTWFRNRMRGYDADASTGATDTNTKCFTVEAPGQDNFTVAACVLGENGHHTTVNDTFSGSSGSFVEGSIYDIHVDTVGMEKLGNYNTVDDAVPVAEQLGGGDAFVDSYLYSSKPAWFGDRPWPWCDPGNFAQSNDRENLPAAYRLINGEDPPAEGGGDATMTVTTWTVTNLIVG